MTVTIQQQVWYLLEHNIVYPVISVIDLFSTVCTNYFEVDHFSVIDVVVEVEIFILNGNLSPVKEIAQVNFKT